MTAEKIRNAFLFPADLQQWNVYRCSCTVQRACKQPVWAPELRGICPVPMCGNGGWMLGQCCWSLQHQDVRESHSNEQQPSVQRDWTQLKGGKSNRTEHQLQDAQQSDLSIGNKWRNLSRITARHLRQHQTPEKFWPLWQVLPVLHISQQKQEQEDNHTLRSMFKEKWTITERWNNQLCLLFCLFRKPRGRKE